jgi:hypothetical protein
MRALMGLIKDRHGTYYARHKVPQRLQEAVADIIGNGKEKQVWLKKSLGTKDLSEANVRGKPIQIEFDKIIARAEAQLKERPLRTNITDIEIKRIAEYFYAHELADDEDLRVDGRGSDPLYRVRRNKPLRTWMQRSALLVWMSMRLISSSRAQGSCRSIDGTSQITSIALLCAYLGYLGLRGEK